MGANHGQEDLPEKFEFPEYSDAYTDEEYDKKVQHYYKVQEQTRHLNQSNQEIRKTQQGTNSKAEKNSGCIGQRKRKEIGDLSNEEQKIIFNEVYNKKMEKGKAAVKHSTTFGTVNQIVWKFIKEHE